MLNKALLAILTITLISCTKTSHSWPPKVSHFPLHIISPISTGLTPEEYWEERSLNQAITGFASQFPSLPQDSLSNGFNAIRIHNWLLEAKLLTGFWKLANLAPYSGFIELNDNAFRNAVSDFFESFSLSGYFLAMRFNSDESKEHTVLEGFRIIYFSPDDMDISRFDIPVAISNPNLAEHLQSLITGLINNFHYSLPSFEPSGFILIPAGCYSRDSSHSIQSCVDQFRIGRFPITIEQWNAVMQIKHDGSVSDRTMPVTNVSWIRVQEFIDTLNANSNHRYRLPNATEWEYACLGVSSLQGGHSSIVQALPKRTFDSESASIDESSGLQPIKRRLPNLSGLFDMPGNSWEWTSDLHLRSETKGLLIQWAEWFTGDQIHRVAMGGSYSSPSSEVGCASGKQVPIAIGSPDIGFRLIMAE